jgi:hypothetical protein
MTSHLARRTGFARRVRAAGLHLLCSVLVAAVVAVIVFRLWFPSPFGALAGGTALFFLLTAVDVCMGPLLTAVIAAPAKPATELRRDLAVIVVLQVVALAYGVHALSLARPVVVSFEIDRFRVVTAADLDPSMLVEAPESLRTLSWSGPVLVGAVKPFDPAQRLRSIDLALAGFDLSLVPSNWREYGVLHDAAWEAAKPAMRLLERYPDQQAALRDIAAARGVRVDELRFLPIVSRHSNWSAVIARPASDIVGYLPVDGFL